MKNQENQDEANLLLHQKLRLLNQASKDLSFQKMRIKKGQTVMDFGCGTGTDLADLSDLVDIHGEVWAVDHDPIMIKNSIINNSKSNVRFLKSSSTKLNFPDCFFNSVRADNVFQNLDKPKETLSEIMRVTKIKGHVVVTNLNWHSLHVTTSFPSIFKDLLSLSIEDLAPYNFKANQTFHDFNTTDFENVNSESLPIQSHDLELFHHIFLEKYSLSEQVKEKISQCDLELFFKDLFHLSNENKFSFSLDQMIISGEKSTTYDKTNNLNKPFSSSI